MNSKRGCIALLLLIWTVAICVVDPVGEFMINDDFAYTTAFETLRNEGVLGPTWLGPQGEGGGPALIIHLLWGLLFSEVFGYSITILRISVLAISIMGSIAFFFLLKATKAGDWVSFWGTLTLMFNPLYFSQSFTYMTDVTFVSLVIISFLLIQRGIDKRQTFPVAIGLVFGLLATLTRQLGVIISVAFVLTCFIQPKGRQFGPRKAVFMTLLVAIVPWLAFEYFLHHSGSTPLTEHQSLYNLLNYPISKGFPDYIFFILGQMCLSIGYTAFLSSPVVALLYGQYFRKTAYRYFFLVVTALFVALELAIITGLLTPPIVFARNVVFNFGIGPILLKDNYILGIERMTSLSPGVFYIFVLWAVLSLGMALPLVYHSVCEISKMIIRPVRNGKVTFLTCLTLIFVLLYGAIIVSIDFRDRYLIPLSAMLIIFLFSYSDGLRDFRFSIKGSAPAAAALAVMIVFSVVGTHDFMALKRSQTLALDYLTRDLKVTPGFIDGGFEFNGYHCYRPDYKPLEGRSWWWVDREDYVITLGDIHGFQKVKEFPFRRLLGSDGAIHILKPNIFETQ